MKRKIVKFTIGCILLLGCIACQQQDSETLTVGVGQLSGVFNPLYSKSVYDGYVSDLVYDSLLRQDKEGNFLPSIAQALPTVSEDGLEVVYQIRKDVKFSDGSALTSEDVAFTMLTIADPSYMGGSSVRISNLEGYDAYKHQQSDTLSGMQILDDYTIRFTFSTFNRNNAEEIGKIAILSSKQFGGIKYNDTSKVEKATTLIGNGPYMLDSYEAGGSAILKKNPYFYDDGYAIETIVVKPMDEASNYEQLANGNIDVLSECIQPSKINQAVDNKSLAYNAYRRGAMGTLQFNALATPTKEVAVRQALAYSFDREAFIESYFDCQQCKGKDVLAYVPSTFQNPLVAISEEDYQKTTINTYDYNMKKAKQLLDDSGWKINAQGMREKEGKPLTIQVLALQDNPYVERMISIWQKNWIQELGIDVQIDYMNMSQISQVVMESSNQAKWSVFFIGMYFNGNDPDVIYSNFHSSQAKDYGSNISKIQDSSLDQMLDEARLETDPNRMKEAYLQIAKKVNELCVVLPVYSNDGYDLYTKRLKHFDTNALYGWTSALREAVLE